MKKFLLLFLLTPLLWGGISLGQGAEPGFFCIESNKCNPEKELALCESNLEKAQADFYTKATGQADGKGKEGINKQVDDKNKEINELSKTYLDCYSKEKTNTTDEQKKAECNKTKYDTDVAAIRLAIVEIKKPLVPLEKSLSCANRSNMQAQLLQLGEVTSHFDLKNLQAAEGVSKEINLDIVDNVEGPTNILNRVLKLMTQVIGTFAVLMLIIGGYFLITSQGDESQLQKGKNIFFYTIVGLLIAFVSFIAVQFVISLIFTSTG